MAGPRPNTIKTGALKSKILNLAQTSVYLVKVQPPTAVQSFLNRFGVNYSNQGENLELLCCEASLPGSSLATHDITNDYHGVTEKMAYRRIYDETIDFTFYVDYDYNIIELFDGWMDYISGVGTNKPKGDYLSPYVNYRMNFPSFYKNNIYITKFEKDANEALYYTFVNAFPIAVTAMPVTYEQSNVLKCSVSFSYMRYIRDRVPGSQFQSTRNPNAPGVPELINRQPDPTDDRFLGPPTAKTFLGQPLNSQQTLNELYEAGRAGRIRSAGEFIGPLQ